MSCSKKLYVMLKEDPEVLRTIFIHLEVAKDIPELRNPKRGVPFYFQIVSAGFGYYILGRAKPWYVLSLF